MDAVRREGRTMTNPIMQRAGRLGIAACAVLALGLFVGGCDYETERDDDSVHDDIGEEPLDHLGGYKSNERKAEEPKKQAEAPSRRRDTAGEEELDTGAMNAKPARETKPEPKAAPEQKPEPEEKAANKREAEPQSKARTRAPRESKVELTEARGVERRVTYVPAPPPAPEYRVPRARSEKRYDDAGEMDLNY